MNNKDYIEIAKGTIKTEACGFCTHYGAKDVNNIPCSWCYQFKEYVCATNGTCKHWELKKRFRVELKNVPSNDKKT
jgi:hypothetical protein